MIHPIAARAPGTRLSAGDATISRSAATPTSRSSPRSVRGSGSASASYRSAARDGAGAVVAPSDLSFELETWVVMHEDLRGVARVRAVFDALVEGLLGYLA
jgi:hypothetical protein